MLIYIGQRDADDAIYFRLRRVCAMPSGCTTKSGRCSMGFGRNAETPSVVYFRSLAARYIYVNDTANQGTWELVTNAENDLTWQKLP